MPGEALGWLLTPVLGADLFPDLFGPELDWSGTSSTAAQIPRQRALMGPFLNPSVLSGAATLPDGRAVRAISTTKSTPTTAALLTAAVDNKSGGAVHDVALLGDTAPLGDPAAALFSGARGFPLTSGTWEGPSASASQSLAADGAEAEAARRSTARIKPGGPTLQTAEELAQITYYDSLHAEYEHDHPHGHDGHVDANDNSGSPSLTDTVALFATDPSALIDPNAATTGQWGSLQNWGVTAVHANMLPTGKVMLWAYSENPLRFWDPATNAIETTFPADPGYNIFCVGHAFMDDGRLFMSGGHVEYGLGLPNASIYNPSTNTWTRVPDMNAGRWYPTSTTLGNGKVLTISGSVDTSYTRNPLPQLYQPTNNTWRNLTTAQLNISLYPYMFQTPSGKVFFAGPSQMSRYLITSGTGSWANVGNSNFGYRDYGTAVMYAPGKVLLVGGGNPPTASAEVIDLNVSTPIWRPVAPMATPRRQLNATLLPDGKVLVTGGSSAAGFNNPDGAVLTAELWDPATETWTTLASATRYRGYHSTAVLLPDGRVLSAGGDGQPNAEVFSPPYLFNGPRPTVTAAPTQVRYGYSFSVETPDAANITKVNLVRLSAVTHSFDQNQRVVPLTFKKVPGGLTITAPASGNRAPPGDYMLFLVNSNGVPSVANIVRLSAVTGAPRTPGGLSAVVVSPSQVNLKWTDTSNNETGFKLERRIGLTGNFVQIATVGPNLTTYEDKGLTRGMQYFYRVRSTNAYGDSGYSNQVSATTPT